MIILYALTSVMLFAVGIMALFQLRLILAGESDVESHDNRKHLNRLDSSSI